MFFNAFLATILERNSRITTVGRSENLPHKNESRASSINFSGNKPEMFKRFENKK